MKPLGPVSIQMKFCKVPIQRGALHILGGGSQVPNDVFARKCMTCSNLHIEMMFLTPFP